MPFSKRLRSVFLTLFASLAPALLAGGIALAGDDVPRPPASISVKKSMPIVAERNASELSPSALGYRDGKSNIDASGDGKPDYKIPNEFQFGRNTLHFDADRKGELPPGIDTNEQAVMNKAPLDDSPLPSYFGLRLTTPMH